MAAPTRDWLEEQTRPDEQPTGGRIIHRSEVEGILSGFAAAFCRGVAVSIRLPARKDRSRPGSGARLHPIHDQVGAIGMYGRLHSPTVTDFGPGLDTQLADVAAETGEGAWPSDDFDLEPDELEELENLADETIESIRQSDEAIPTDGDETAGSDGATTRLAFAPPVVTVPVINAPVGAPTSPTFRPVTVRPSATGGGGALVFVTALVTLVDVLLQLATRVDVQVARRRRQRRVNRCLAILVGRTNRFTRQWLEGTRLDEYCLPTRDTVKRKVVRSMSRKPGRNR